MQQAAQQQPARIGIQARQLALDLIEPALGTQEVAEQPLAQPAECPADRVAEAQRGPASDADQQQPERGGRQQRRSRAEQQQPQQPKYAEAQLADDLGRHVDDSARCRGRPGNAGHGDGARADDIAADR